MIDHIRERYKRLISTALRRGNSFLAWRLVMRGSREIRSIK